MATIGMQGTRRRSLAPPLGLSWTALIAIVLVVATYHYTLFTLVRGLTLQTPLAYLALVPIGSALFIWVAHARGRFSDLRARDLPLDFALGRTLGIGLLLVALTLAALLPGSLGARFWLYRLDLLSLPFFVAGLIALLFGVRRLWAVKSAIAFLLLAWPVPYGLVLGSWLDAFTELTAAAVRIVNAAVPMARPVGSVPDLFIVDHAGQSFVVSIGSACSGVNSVVGFILIGIALLGVVRGSAIRRAAWLVTGLTITWLLNVTRIQIVLAAGALFGPDIAFEAFHPLAGVVVFNIGIVAMIWAVPRFGIRFVELPASDRPTTPSVQSDGRHRRPSLLTRGDAVARMVVVLAAGLLFGPAVGLPALDPMAGLVALTLGITGLILVVLFLAIRFVVRPADRAASPKGSAHGWLRRSSMLALGIGVAALVGVANSGYARYEAITGDLGNARLVRFDIRTAQIAGWSSSFVASLDQAKQFFGDQASWARVMYAPTRSASLQSSHPLYVDVIDTDDAGSLAAYTIADCYQFHHYRIDAELSADIGAGVQAEVVTYFDPKDRSDWSAVWWEWPKEFDGGVRYERIVMFIPNSNAVAFQGFDPAAPTSGVAPFQNAERFLVTAARDIVRAQLATSTADADGGTR